MADYLRTGLDEPIVVARVIGVMVGDGDDLDGLVGHRPDLRHQAIVIRRPGSLVSTRITPAGVTRTIEFEPPPGTTYRPGLTIWIGLDRLAATPSLSRGLLRRQSQRGEGQQGGNGGNAHGRDYTEPVRPPRP